MFRKIEDALRALAEESYRSSLVFAALPERLSFAPEPHERWSSGDLSWHIVQAYQKILNQLGAKLPDFPSSMERRMLQRAHGEVAEKTSMWLAELKDTELLDAKAVYGQTWTVGYGLWIMFLHEAHHRGQLTAWLREAGLAVPDVYGPARKT